ncbi:MAG: hypothetical protein LBQ08_04220 [Holosporaceae bacterium]|jgi:hypothetical protein|nr:hypothetical protein [Holosporaceae bacterium]
MRDGATQEEGTAKVGKDLPIAKEMVKLEQEIKKDTTHDILKVSDSRSQPQSNVNPNSVSLMLNVFANQEADDAKTKAAKALKTTTRASGGAYVSKKEHSLLRFQK